MFKVQIKSRGAWVPTDSNGTYEQCAAYVASWAMFYAANEIRIIAA